MTPMQAEEFLARYEVVNHLPNTASGFSGTLMREITTGDYTLAFRSTEYLPASEGGDRERDFGTNAEIASLGFALGQIASMESYYEHLIAGESYNAADGQWEYDPTLDDFSSRFGAGNIGGTLNVSGYSLSGNLANVFAALHPEVEHAYVLNGTGLGNIGQGDLKAMVGDFKARLADSAVNLADPGVTSIYDSISQPGLYAQYQSIVNAMHLIYETSYTWLGEEAPRNDKITQLYGEAANNDFQVVANSGLHVPPIKIFIEDQPDVQNWNLVGEDGDFGKTHSITLLVDSLAVMSVFERLNLDMSTPSGLEAAYRVLAGGTAERATETLGDGIAERDSLEVIVTKLHKIFVGTEEILPSDGGVRGFSNLANRDLFYKALDSINQSIAVAAGETSSLVFVDLTLLDARSIERVAYAGIDEDTRLAYRYALKELNPFALIGVDYSTHNANGALELYDDQSGLGGMTEQYLIDRAGLLAEVIESNVNDRPKSLITNGFVIDGPVAYEDLASGLKLFSGQVTRAVMFGNDEQTSPELLVGDERSDRIYGLGGDDIIHGDSGRDHLEGNVGNDQLFGDADNDELRGGAGDDTLTGGKGNDRLDGGLGFDIYRYQEGGWINAGDPVMTWLSREIEGDGNDTITDPDGLGAIHFTTKEGVTHVLNGGRKIDHDADIWQSVDQNGEPDDQFTYQYVPSGETGLLRINGGDITIKRFRPGDLGIVLAGIETPPVTLGTLEVTGTERDNFFVVTATNPYQGGYQSESVGPVPSATYLNYALPVSYQSGDPTESAKARLIEGGAGTDLIFSGWLVDGNDHLYGDSVIDPGAMSQEANGALGDFLSGLLNEDLLVGSVGDDVLFGGDHSDRLYGGAGADILIGDDNAQHVTGYFYDWTVERSIDGDPFKVQIHIPNNFLWAAASDDAFGDDRLDGGAGNDWIAGQAGNDTLFGGAGNDTLSGGFGRDAIFGDDGDDLIEGDSAPRNVPLNSSDIVVSGLGRNSPVAAVTFDNDWLDGGAGRDVIYGQGGNDNIFGGDDSDYLFGDRYVTAGIPGSWAKSGNDHIDGGKGNDFIFGDEGDDTLIGGPGIDYLDGGEGDDELVFGAKDTVIGGGGENRFVVDRNAGDGTAQIQSSSLSDIVRFEGDTLPSDVSVNIQYQNANTRTSSVHVGGLEVRFDGNRPQNYEFATAGGFDYRELPGIGTEIRISGDATDNNLIGGEEDNVYLLSSGSGHDTIFDFGGSNLIRFGEGVSAASLAWTYNPFSQTARFQLSYGYQDDSVGIVGGEAGTVDVFEFADGATLSLSELLSRQGGFPLQTEDNVYHLDVGDNNTTIEDLGGNDRISFGAGITPESVSWQYNLWSSGAEFRVFFGDQGDRVTIAEGEFGAIENFEFADGSTLSFDELIARQGGLPSQVFGSGRFRAHPSDETLIIGTDGDDWFEDGDVGDVAYVGGLGNDYLQIFAGDEYKFLFQRGDGIDYIELAEDYTEETIEFGPGITPESLTLRQFYTDGYKYPTDPNASPRGLVTDDLQIEYGEGDRVVIRDGLGDTQIEYYQFQNGETLTHEELLARAGFSAEQVVSEIYGPNQMSVFGTVRDDRLISNLASGGFFYPSPDDFMRGLEGNDWLESFAGDDTLYGDFGSDVLLGGAGDDELYADDTYTDNASNILDGGEGDDYLDSSIGDDILIGGAGRNVVYADLGNDVILWNAGDGLLDVSAYWTDPSLASQVADTLSLGRIDPAQIRLARLQDALAVRVGNDPVAEIEDWYLSSDPYQSIKNLQVITGPAQAGSGSSGGLMPLALLSASESNASSLPDAQVLLFDFASLVAGFDAYQTQNPGAVEWAPADEIAAHLVSASDTEVIGGEIAFTYARDGSLAALSPERATAVLQAQHLGSQTLSIANRAPLLVSPLTPHTVTAGDQFLTTIPANTFLDPDSFDWLTLSLAQSDGSALPAWLAFNPD
ncbi:MAG TPA: putative Ig domain-containing protein, partial [Pirellulales bacterium]|nr:putative Ig domain-containing protein [Pirellulales bacterium]